MNRFLNALMSSFRSSPVAAAVRQQRLIAAMEPLEGRQFFSASPVGHQSDAPTADTAVHVSAKVAPLAVWNVSGVVDGEKNDLKFTITIMSDENGVVTGTI